MNDCAFEELTLLHRKPNTKKEGKGWGGEEGTEGRKHIVRGKGERERERDMKKEKKRKTGKEK